MLKVMGWSSSSMFEILLVDEQPVTLVPSGNTFTHFTILAAMQKKCPTKPASVETSMFPLLPKPDSFPIRTRLC